MSHTEVVFMRVIVLAAASACLLLSTAASRASPFRDAPVVDIGLRATPAQVGKAQSRDFRRCMRAKYGPRYYQGVKRPHRYIMAQACGG